MRILNSRQSSAEQKKAPRDWKLQYSLDGETYTDIDSAVYIITNNKAMELAFDSFSLPDECSNQLTFYIRMVVYNDIAINGTNTIVNQTSGDAAVNNIATTGTTLSVITSLYSSTVSLSDGSVIFDDDTVMITDNNGGVDIYYSVNGGEDTLYSSSFNPFDTSTAKVGDMAVITAYSQYNDIVSDSVTATVTFGGVNINSFDYTTYSEDVVNGAVASTGGVYDESGRMTATADGTTQYVPLWNDDNMAFSVSPDDGLTWSEESGFIFKVSTAGYENTNFSCKPYITAQGPDSVTLQYSLDGETYYNIQSDVGLADSSALEQLFLTASLPSACDNQTVIYIRLATTQNLTDSGTTLHQNESKGNLYVNNAIIAGEDNGEYKMPYTNKATSFFVSSGTIKYVSPDGMPMQYMVYDSNNNLVLSGTYPSAGIQLTSASGFDEAKQTPYRVLVWVQEDEETSLVNTASYYYKGDTIAEFDYNSTTKLLSSYISSDGTYANETDGVNGGFLSMYPDGETATTLDYTGTYGVKVSYSTTNPFATTKSLDNPDGNGYWLIQTSSEGYYNVTLSAEQVSSNKGPRDWSIAYSTDGENYTYLTASNARAVSNDAYSDTVETYSNITLPSECDNQEVLFIKIFINGGESVDGTELADVTKGNNGIDAVEICGTPQATTITLTITVLESKTADEGSVGFESVSVYANGTLKGTTDENGQLTFDITQGKDYTVTVSGDGIVERAIVITDAQTAEISVPILVFDANSDGYINIKDFAIINEDSKYDSCKQYFQNFINTKTSEFTCA
ncbi:MAG: hypothetical protein LUG95_01640 [Clostridiales bacterium]|nr:hypothetical protein [Clostridiales bacterium]